MIIRIYSTITVAEKSYLDIMIDKGLLTILKSNLIYNNGSLFEHIVWSLCNIMGECEEYKILLYEKGIYDLVLKEYNSIPNKASIRKVFSWFLSNSFKGKPKLNSELVI